MNIEKLIVVGTVATLMSSIANITAIFVLRGLEPAFVFSPFHRLTVGLSYLLYPWRRLLCNSPSLYFNTPTSYWPEGVTSVKRIEEGPHFPTRAQCAFHHRTSTICCIATGRGRNTNGIISKGFFSRARGVVGLGRPRQESPYQESNHRNSRSSRGHTSRSAEEGSRTQGHDATNGITLSYDVWRTVENNGPRNGHNAEGQWNER